MNDGVKPRPLTDDELADLREEGWADKGAWPIPRLFATVDALLAERNDTRRFVSR